MSVDEIREAIGADTLGYLSVEGVKTMAKDAGCDFCVGCFTEEYPVPVPENVRKSKFETKIPTDKERVHGDGKEL